MKGKRDCRAADLPWHLHANGADTSLLVLSCTESPGFAAMCEGIPQGPCSKVSTDEDTCNRTGGYTPVDGEVIPASPCWKLSRCDGEVIPASPSWKLPTWDVKAVISWMCTKGLGFEPVITEVSKSSLEKWNQGKKRSSSRWDVKVDSPLRYTQSSGFEPVITEASKSPLERRNQGKKRSSSSKRSRWDVGRESVSGTASTDELEVTQFLPLSEDLLVKILALLPLPKLIQLRLVCRWWDKCLLRTPHLWKSWAAHQQCWFVMVRKSKPFFAKEFTAYCITNSPLVGGRKTGHWLSLSPLLELPQVAPYVGGKEGLSVVCREQCVPCQPFSLSFCLVAGGQGHICFMFERWKQDPPALEDAGNLDYYEMVFESGNPTPLVVDILTGATEVLPPPQSPGFSARDAPHINASLNMTFLPKISNAGYYVVLNSRINGRYLEVFSSDTGSWRAVLDWYTPHFPATSEVQSADIFWLAYDGCSWSLPYGNRMGVPINGVRGYNVRADAWSEVSVEFPSDAHGVHSLITKHKGCLVLADLDLVYPPSFGYELGKPGGVGIWVLQQSSSPSPGTARWVQIARTPPEYWEGFYDILNDCSSTYFRIKFLSFGGLICMTGAVWDEDGSLTPLVYDLDLDSWYHLPAYKGGMDVMGLCALHPASPFRN